MTGVPDEPLAPIDDPEVRARLAELYVKESRDRRRFGYTPSSSIEGRLMHVAASWEGVRNRLAFLVALTLVRMDGSVSEYPCLHARDFAASIVLADRSMTRWQAAYRASKDGVS